MLVTVGRIVHYIAYNGTHLAALVLAVDSEHETCDLAVFTALPNVNGKKNGGIQFHFDVPGGSELQEQPGTWVWPPRV